MVYWDVRALHGAIGLWFPTAPWNN